MKSTAQPAFEPSSSASRPPLVADDASSAPVPSSRYARHLALPQVGAVGQRRLANARVLCVGAGGLGSPVALYLAAAGIGHLDIIDDDIVSESNLQRQILHRTSGVGGLKSESAASALRDLNPHIAVGTLNVRLEASNAVGIVSNYDIVVDGTDTFETRYVINDACVLSGVPYVFASVLRFSGYAMAVVPGETACYRCAFPTPPPAGSQPTCEQAGVLGAMCGVLGSVQAMEVLKLILGIGEPLVDRLFRIDALTMHSDVLGIKRDAACAVCGDSPTITNVGTDNGQESLGWHSQVPIDTTSDGEDGEDGGDEVRMRSLEVNALQLRQLLESRASGDSTFTLLDVREPFEIEICSLDAATVIPQADVPGNTDIAGWDRSKTVIVMCRSGVRSAAVCEYLRSQGFVDVRNLAGGILGWIDNVDSSLTRY